MMVAIPGAKPYPGSTPQGNSGGNYNPHMSDLGLSEPAGGDLRSEASVGAARTHPALGALAVALTPPSGPWQPSPGARAEAVVIWREVETRVMINSGGAECAAPRLK